MVMDHPTHIAVKDLRISYGPREILHGVTLNVPRNGIFGIIGPAGSGKSSFLTCLNRTLEITPGASQAGSVIMDAWWSRGVASRMSFAKDELGARAGFQLN